MILWKNKIRLKLLFTEKMSQSFESDKEFVAKINEILSQILFYYGSILSSIFIAGNILNILIWSRKKLIKEMIGFYNVIVSVCNIVSIVMLNLVYYPTSLNYQDFTTFSNFSCISIMYFTRVSVQMSSWLHVARIVN